MVVLIEVDVEGNPHLPENAREVADFVRKNVTNPNKGAPWYVKSVKAVTPRHTSPA